MRTGASRAPTSTTTAGSRRSRRTGLIVQADADGDVCFYTSARVDLIVDVNARVVRLGHQLVPEPTDRHPRRRAAFPRSAPAASYGSPSRRRSAARRSSVSSPSIEPRRTGYVTAYGCDDLAVPARHRRHPIRPQLRRTGHARRIEPADRPGRRRRRDLPACQLPGRHDRRHQRHHRCGDRIVRQPPHRHTFAGDARPAGRGERRRSDRRSRRRSGAKTVIGQLTVDRASRLGIRHGGRMRRAGSSNPDIANSRSDLNYDGQITPAASNRLIVQADADGEICLRTTVGRRRDRRHQRRRRCRHRVVPQPAHRHPFRHDHARTPRNR